MSVVLVTGCGRSGTSLVARLVAEALDVPRDPLWTERQDGLNPDGYYETPELIALNEALLCYHGYGYLKPPAAPLTIQGVEEAYQALGFRGDRQAAAQGLLKDPRLLLLQDWWAREYPNAVWLVVRRDPDTLVDRWQRVYGFSRARAREIVEHYERAVNKALARDDVQTWAVQYELLTDRATMVQEARHACDCVGAETPEGFFGTIRARRRAAA